MHSVTKILIRENDPLYEYCQQQCRLSNNMYNATLFVCRQLMTGLPKNPEDRHPLETQVIELVGKTLPRMGKKQKMPAAEKPYVNYYWLASFMTKSENPDYKAKGFPSHGAQKAIRRVCDDLASFRAALREYRRNPAKFKARPQMPRYKKSGGECTFVCTNGQLTLPLTRLKAAVGDHLKGRLKEVQIVPSHGQYVLTLIMEGSVFVPILHAPARIAAIDPGLENFAAISNNIGQPGLLFKGGVLKSINHLANKHLAREYQRQYRNLSEEERKDKKLQSTDVVKGIYRKRQRRMDDVLHKYASRIIRWCTDHRIDTLVVGSNKGQKQNVNMGRVNNQNFCQIPYRRFKQMLAYRCEREGIRYVEQEESYTSKASFLDLDEMPVWQAGEEKPHSFSGKRFRRGLYRSADGTIVNADLNGAANIGRKAYPDLFQKAEFEKIEVIRNPYPNKSKPVKRSRVPVIGTESV